MKKINLPFFKPGIIILFLILLSSNFFLNAHAQNNVLSSKLINPLGSVYQGPNEVNSLVAAGYFDNYIVSTTPGYMSTTVVCNPFNTSNWLGTENRIILGSSYSVVFYSADCGANWLSTNVASGGSVPVLAADTHNNIFLGYLNSSLNFFCQKSTNGGANWTSMGYINSSNSNDRLWIWCDQTSGTYTNNVYAAYYNYNVGTNVYFNRSTNNGITWNATITLGSSSYNPEPSGVCDKNGNVFSVWFNGGGLSLKKSSDGGATFGGTISIASFSHPGVVNYGRYCLKTDIRVSANPQIACDKTNGPYANYLYCVCGTNPAGTDNADIYFFKSTDNGATWSGNVKLNDDNTTTDQWHPAISVDSLGRVFVYWYDSRNDPTNNLMTEEWGTCSTNGGVTFMPDFMISNQNFNPNTVKLSQGSGQAYYMGDYQGIASGGKNTIPFYSCQNNSLNDYMAYLPDYGMYFSKSPDTVGRNSTYPQSVKIPMMGPYTGTVNYTANLTTPPSTGNIYLVFPNPSKVLTGSPDSVLLNIITTINVTPGVYTVNVTGNEAGGPRTHTRSFTLVVTNVTGISNNNQIIPDDFALYQNYPNPFNPETKIKFDIPDRFPIGTFGNDKVVLKIYDILGKEIQTLVNESLQPGSYEVTFDGSNLPSGIYFYSLQTVGFTETKKLILLK